MFFFLLGETLGEMKQLKLVNKNKKEIWKIVT